MNNVAATGSTIALSRKKERLPEPGSGIIRIDNLVVNVRACVLRKRQDRSASSSGEMNGGNDDAVGTIGKPRCRQAHFF